MKWVRIGRWTYTFEFIYVMRGWWSIRTVLWDTLLWLEGEESKMQKTRTFL